MMTTRDVVPEKKFEPSAEATRSQRMGQLAREQGLSLTRPDGLSKQFTKSVLDTALNEELTGWANRPLNGVYAAVVIDAVVIKVRVARSATNPCTPPSVCRNAPNGGRRLGHRPTFADDRLTERDAPLSHTQCRHEGGSRISWGDTLNHRLGPELAALGMLLTHLPGASAGQGLEQF